MPASNRPRLGLCLRLACLLLFPAAVGCTGAATAPDAGGTGGSCVPPTIVDDNTVADFEDGFGSVLQRGTPPRNGGFYAYSDQLDACVQTPAVGASMPAATEIEGGGRCGSRYAFRFFGRGCTGYAGVGTDLAAPLPADSGSEAPDAATTAEKRPYDLSGYRQIRSGAATAPRRSPCGRTSSSSSRCWSTPR